MVLREFILPVTKLSQTELTYSILDSRVFVENKKQKDIGKTRNNFILI